jgi:hypothetical protein
MTFVTTYKQADLTLTGTMRKAQLAATATKTSRRQNGQHAHSGSPAPSMSDQYKRRVSEISTTSQFIQQAEEKTKQCEKCRVKFSPFWWLVDPNQESDDRTQLCHKCHWVLVHGKSVINGDVKREGSLPNGINRSHDTRVSIAI